MNQLHPSQVPVTLESHSPEWGHRFRQEKLAIERNLPEIFKGIQYFGSTSIPNLTAKPTIDILAGTCAFPWNESSDQKLQDVGFTFYKANHEKWRVYLKPFKEKVRGYHLHIVEIDSDHWQSHLLFRDYLRAHPDVAAEYGRLKLNLVDSLDTTKGNRKAYQNGKSEFVQHIMQVAKIWHDKNRLF